MERVCYGIVTPISGGSWLLIYAHDISVFPSVLSLLVARVDGVSLNVHCISECSVQFGAPVDGDHMPRATSITTFFPFQ